MISLKPGDIVRPNIPDIVRALLKSQIVAYANAGLLSEIDTAELIAFLGLRDA
jgi:hypothetical protein